MGVAQVECSKLVVLIESSNRHTIHANINKPNDADVCRANDLYKAKTMPERKLC